MNPRTAMVGGGIGSILGGLFNDYEAPFREGGEAARPWYERASGEFGPYTEAGRNAIGKFQNWLNGMGDPSGFINKMMGQYQESPYAQYLKRQNEQAGINAGSASGMVGSTPWIQQIQQNASNIASQDMNQWLQHVLGINTQYGQGWNDIMRQGLGAAGSRANIFSNRANMEGGLAAGQAQAENQRWNDIFGGVGNLAGGLFF